MSKEASAMADNHQSA